MSDPFSNPSSPQSAGWGQTHPPGAGGPPGGPADQGWGQPGQFPGAPPGHAGDFGQGDWGQHPFAPPPPRKSRVGMIVLIVVGLFVVLVVAVMIVAFMRFSEVRTGIEEGGGGFGAPLFDDGIPEGTRLLDTESAVGGAGATTVTFDVGDSAEIQIDVIGLDGFDPVITLFGPDGRQLQSDDDGGTLLNSRIVRTLSSGTHTVEVVGWNNTTGRFRAVVTQP